MGTDIHLVAEVAIPGAGWAWVRPTEPETCRWCRLRDEDERECWFCKGSTVARSFYDARNYDVFAILADVRNGRGFAGVPTGDGFDPIARPRGLPRDFALVDHYYYEPGGRVADGEVEYWAVYIGDHSFSWLLVAEIRAFDWLKVTTSYGVVSLEEYRTKWRGRKKLTDDPHAAGIKGYAGGVFGKDVETVSADTIEEVGIDRVIASMPGKRIFVRVGWPHSYQSTAAYFLESVDNVAREARRLRPDATDEEIRLVFGFDSWGP